MARLFPGGLGPTGTVNYTTSDRSVGLAFTPTVNGEISELWYYRHSTNNADTGWELQLWQEGNTTNLEGFSVPQAGAAGWLAFPLATPRAVTAGVTYFITRREAAAAVLPMRANSSPPTPDDGLAFGANYLRTGTALQYPSVGGTEYYPCVDVTFSATTNPPAQEDPVTYGQLQTELQQWHSSNATGYPYSLTRQTWGALSQEIIDAAGRHTSVMGRLGSLPQSLAGKAADIFAALGYLATISEAIKAITDLLPARHDEHGADLADLQARLVALEQTQTREHNAIHGSLNDLGWTAVDEVTFTADKLWQVPADRYDLSVQSYGSARPLNLYDGASMLFRLGWWCPYDNGRHGTRRFLDAPFSELSDGGRRMHGVLVSTGPDVTATLRAFDRAS